MASETLSDADFAKRVGIPLATWQAFARRGAPRVRGKRRGEGRPWPKTLHWWIEVQVKDAAAAVPVDASQTDFGSIIGVGVRQVDNLLKKGMPATTDAKRRVPLAKGVQWYVEFKQREIAHDDTDEMEIEKLRKMRADRELAELNLAERRRRVMVIDDILREVEEVFSKVHGVNRALLDRLCPRLVMISDEAGVRRLLEPELQKGAVMMSDWVATCAGRAADVAYTEPVQAPESDADSDDA